jgi:hypothetical protein
MKGEELNPIAIKPLRKTITGNPSRNYIIISCNRLFVHCLKHCIFILSSPSIYITYLPDVISKPVFRALCITRNLSSCATYSSPITGQLVRRTVVHKNTFIIIEGLSIYTPNTAMQISFNVTNLYKTYYP